jgi:flagellar biosynthesis component FlhA
MATLRLIRRSVHAIPVVGRITREVTEGDADNKWYLAVILLTLWILAGMTWGLPAVVIPFIMAAPLCLVMLIAISRG